MKASEDSPARRTFRIFPIRHSGNTRKRQRTSMLNKALHPTAATPAFGQKPQRRVVAAAGERRRSAVVGRPEIVLLALPSRVVNGNAGARLGGRES